MKVVQINAYFNYGSTGNIANKLIKKGREENIDSYSIYWLMKDEKIEDKNIIYCGEENNKSIYLKIFEYIFNGGKISYNHNRTLKVLEELKKINPDIIHLHNLHGDFEYGSLDIPFFFNEISKMKKKVIWTLHDCWAITGRCYHFEYKNCEKWKIGCGNCPQKNYDRHGILKDYSSKNWRIKKELYKSFNNLTIVTVSDWLKSIVEKSILKNKNIITIYNGIDTNIFKNYKIKKIKPEKKIILGIGWDRKKRFKDYYKLANLLNKDEELLIVGERPLFRRIKKLPKNIRIIERTNNPEKLAKIYNEADVYFNPSPAETFGLTTAEALGCGIPVVGYNVTATPEIIGECGRTVKKGEIKEVLDAIRELYKDEKLKEKCKERIIKNFTLDKMLTSYIELYRKTYQGE